LGKLKKMVRKPELPLSQAIRRISELQRVGGVEGTMRASAKSDQPRRMNNPGHVPRLYDDWNPFKSVYHNGFKLSSETGDNCVQIDHKIVLVDNILLKDGEKKVVVRCFRMKEDFFTYPLKSSKLGIMRLSRLSGHHEVLVFTTLMLVSATER
jgi:hypothetical protein